MPAQWPGIASTTRNNHERIGSTHDKDGTEKKEIWSTLLNNVASGKKLPEKNLIVLGGTQESQREFIDSLAQEQQSQTRLRQQDRTKARKAPVANRFALGYTYQNVWDVDHEGKADGDFWARKEDTLLMRNRATSTTVDIHPQRAVASICTLARTTPDDRICI